MDIATSTISNIVTAGVPHAAQEARRDSMARETIPQINQNAQSANNAAVSQGSVQTAPVNSSLFIQTDVLIKANGEKVSSKKELAKTEKKEDTKETKGTGGGKAASSSSASGASLNQNVTASGAMNAALGGSFGSSTGASYSQNAEDKRKKGEGYSSKAIANKYNSSRPNFNLGMSVNVSA
ncbi:unknown [Succinatimonas sp. CAG:777]|nr:unknown [Succinatimonas sp. CAG:777]